MITKKINIEGKEITLQIRDNSKNCLEGSDMMEIHYYYQLSNEYDIIIIPTVWNADGFYTETESNKKHLVKVVYHIPNIQETN